MYINPFLAGVLATIGVEMLLMIAYGGLQRQLVRWSTAAVR